VTGVSLYPQYDRSQAPDSVTYSQNAFHAILKLQLAHISISAFLGHPGQPLDRLHSPLSFFSNLIQFILEKSTDQSTFIPLGVVRESTVAYQVPKDLVQVLMLIFPTPSRDHLRFLQAHLMESRFKSSCCDIEPRSLNLRRMAEGGWGGFYVECAELGYGL
jgi:hypothetical protein